MRTLNDKKNNFMQNKRTHISLNEEHRRRGFSLTFWIQSIRVKPCVCKQQNRNMLVFIIDNHRFTSTLR